MLPYAPKAAKRGTVAELAILLLSKEWPQNLKSIHSKLRTEHGKAVSMQATHKSLARLVGQNIVVKQRRQYSLNPKWLEQINSFSAQAKKAYSTRNSQRLKKTLVERSKEAAKNPAKLVSLDEL